MNTSSARLHVAAASATLVLLAAQPAAAEEVIPVGSQHTDISVTAPHARIVNAYRSRAATAYERRFERVSDDGYDWAPIGYRDVVRVVVEVVDPRRSRVDADERPQRVILQLDPSQLNSEQDAALSSRRVSERIAPFRLNISSISSTTRRINAAQSHLCGSDEILCEDRLVFEDAPVESIRLAVE